MEEVNEKTTTDVKTSSDIKEYRNSPTPHKCRKLSNPPIDDFQIFGDLVVSELRNLRSRENQNALKRMILRAISHISEVDDRNATRSAHLDESNVSELCNYPSRSSSVSSFHSKFSPEEPGIGYKL